MAHFSWDVLIDNIMTNIWLSQPSGRKASHRKFGIIYAK